MALPFLFLSRSELLAKTITFQKLRLISDMICILKCGLLGAALQNPKEKT
jgi:hypothetical protein